jgi:hypothetical protein
MMSCTHVCTSRARSVLSRTPLHLLHSRHMHTCCAVLHATDCVSHVHACCLVHMHVVLLSCTPAVHACCLAHMLCPHSLWCLVHMPVLFAHTLCCRAHRCTCCTRGTRCARGTRTHAVLSCTPLAVLSRAHACCLAHMMSCTHAVSPTCVCDVLRTPTLACMSSHAHMPMLSCTPAVPPCTYACTVSRTWLCDLAHMPACLCVLLTCQCCRAPIRSCPQTLCVHTCLCCLHTCLRCL